MESGEARKSKKIQVKLDIDKIIAREENRSELQKDCQKIKDYGIARVYAAGEKLIDKYMLRIQGTEG